MFQLRPYQDDLIARTRAALSWHRAVVLQAPTGAGKTGLMSYMLGGTAAGGHRGMFCVHRQELIDQTHRTFEAFGIPHAIFAAGYPVDLSAPVQLCSIDTLAYRLRKSPEIANGLAPRLLAIDECHHAVSPTWRSVIERFPGVFQVGLSATPERMDGKGLGDIYTEIVQGPQISWLVANGWLAPYEAFAPSVPDVSGMHTHMGDYARKEVEAAMDKPKVVGDIVLNYLQRARGKRAVVFCATVKHSLSVATEFNAAGVVAIHLDGDTPREVRREMVAEFRDGNIDVLTNVDLFGEGFDLPEIEVGIFGRPTKSLPLFMQQCGRTFRTAAGKTHATLFDHAGNLERLGLPDDERNWSLAGRAKGGATVKTKRCPICFAVHRPAPKCPACGFEYAADREAENKRDPKKAAGDLKKIDPVAWRAQQDARKREIWQARRGGYGSLVALAVARGYDKPEGWARIQMGLRRA